MLLEEHESSADFVDHWFVDEELFEEEKVLVEVGVDGESGLVDEREGELVELELLFDEAVVLVEDEPVGGGVGEGER